MPEHRLQRTRTAYAEDFDDRPPMKDDPRTEDADRLVTTDREEADDRAKQERGAPTWRHPAANAAEQLTHEAARKGQ